MKRERKNRTAILIVSSFCLALMLSACDTGGSYSSNNTVGAGKPEPASVEGSTTKTTPNPDATLPSAATEEGFDSLFEPLLIIAGDVGYDKSLPLAEKVDNVTGFLSESVKGHEMQLQALLTELESRVASSEEWQPLAPTDALYEDFENQGISMEAFEGYMTALGQVGSLLGSEASKKPLLSALPDVWSGLTAWHGSVFTAALGASLDEAALQGYREQLDVLVNKDITP